MKREIAECVGVQPQGRGRAPGRQVFWIGMCVALAVIYCGIVSGGI